LLLKFSFTHTYIYTANALLMCKIPIAKIGEVRAEQTVFCPVKQLVITQFINLKKGKLKSDLDFDTQLYI